MDGDRLETDAILAVPVIFLLVFYAGKIVESGPVEEILKNPRHPYTQLLLRSLPSLDRPRREPLEAIAGSPPNLLTPISGCVFADRCPYKMARCTKESPPFFGSAACWMHDA